MIDRIIDWIDERTTFIVSWTIFVLVLIGVSAILVKVI